MKLKQWNKLDFTYIIWIKSYIEVSIYDNISNIYSLLMVLMKMYKYTVYYYYQSQQIPNT